MATLSEDTHPLLAEAFAVWTDKGGGKGGHDHYCPVRYRIDSVG